MAEGAHDGWDEAGVVLELPLHDIRDGDVDVDDCLCLCLRLYSVPITTSDDPFPRRHHGVVKGSASGLGLFYQHSHILLILTLLLITIITLSLLCGGRGAPPPHRLEPPPDKVPPHPPRDQAPRGEVQQPRPPGVAAPGHQAARRDEGHGADRVGEVGRQADGQAPAEGVPHDVEPPPSSSCSSLPRTGGGSVAEPAHSRTGQDVEDLREVQPLVVVRAAAAVRVRVRVRGVRPPPPEVVEQQDAAPLLLGQGGRQPGEGDARRGDAREEEHALALALAHVLTAGGGGGGRAELEDADGAVRGGHVAAAGEGVGRVGEEGEGLGGEVREEGGAWRGDDGGGGGRGGGGCVEAQGGSRGEDGGEGEDDACGEGGPGVEDVHWKGHLYL